MQILKRALETLRASHQRGLEGSVLVVHVKGLKTGQGFMPRGEYGSMYEKGHHRSLKVTPPRCRMRRRSRP